jgi:transcriptional regulator with XRE-family HTH domain
MRYRVNMSQMTENLRAELRAEIARRRIKQTELARELGVSRTHLSNMLNGQRGELPSTWARLLDRLELELALRPKA